jgi:MFS superfamily sulfate permease-like transporter
VNARLQADILAGLGVAGILLPEAVAYAGIAGLPANHGVLAAIAGALVYAIVGRSRFAVVAPTSSSAAILGAGLATLPDDGYRAAFATIVVALVGLAFLAAGFFRLGAVANFVSRPVLRGFTFGLALTIIVKQVPELVGVHVAGRNLFETIAGLASTVPRWHLPSIATGLLALALLIAFRRLPKLPGAFLTIIAGIGLSFAVDLPAHGVALIGTIDFAPGWPTLPPLDREAWATLGQLVLPLCLMLFAESWGTMRGLALAHGDRVAADRELGALGWSNLASALVNGMPVGAGFSAGTANEAAGATSRLAAAIAAGGLTAMGVFFAPLIGRLPHPVLAAVVIAALTHALSPGPLARLFRLGRDHGVAVAAAFGVIAFGTLNGMLLAILLSIVVVLRRFANPRVPRLGQLGDSRDYVDISRHPDAVAPAGMTIWRPAGPLFFANAERVLGMIAANGDLSGPVIISLEETADIDTTALDALLEFAAVVEQAGGRLWLARAHDHVRDLLRAAGADDLVARSTYSVADAVAAAQPRPMP